METIRMATASDDTRLRILLALLSVVVGLLLLAAKFYAFHLTRSSAILSDALESIVNVAAAALALLSVYIATRPADQCHPYGHGKIEYFSAGFEGALIILAAIGIFRVGFDRLVHPAPIQRLETGMWIVFAAAAVNGILGAVLLRAGKRTRSPALEADGRHLMTDVVSSAAVLLGLLLAGWKHLYWMDGAVAVGVGIHILVSGCRLILQSFRGLMDTSDPDLMKRISELIVRNRRSAWIDIHRLRAWRSGAEIHIDLHLILPKDMRLEEAHAEAQFLEQLLFDHIDGTTGVLVHIDPCRPGDCPICGKPSCTCRKADHVADHIWDIDGMTTGRRSVRL